MRERQWPFETRTPSRMVEGAVAAVAAYLLACATYYVLLWDRRTLRNAETFRGVSGGELAELYQLGSVSGIRLELINGNVPAGSNFAFLESTFPVVGGVVTGLPIVCSTYIVAKRRPARAATRWWTVGLAVAVPYALLVGWRALAFGPLSFTTIPHDNSVWFEYPADWTATGRPGTAVLVATLLAACCGLLGTKLAQSRLE